MHLMGRPRRTTGFISLTPELIRRLKARARQTNQTPEQIVAAALEKYFSETGVRSEAWARARAYAAKSAQRLGIRSERDIQRAIDEYRRGDVTPHATARRR